MLSVRLRWVKFMSLKFLALAPKLRTSVLITLVLATEVLTTALGACPAPANLGIIAPSVAWTHNRPWGERGVHRLGAGPARQGKRNDFESALAEVMPELVEPVMRVATSWRGC